MTRAERINSAYNYLIWQKVISGQEDVAKAMSSTQPNVSQALKGVPRVLTDKFIRRFCNSFPVINVEWLLNENGEMLKQHSTIHDSYPTEQSPSPESSIIELASTLIKENEALRKQLTAAIIEVRKLREDMLNDREALMSIRSTLSSFMYANPSEVRIPLAADRPHP